MDALTARLSRSQAKETTLDYERGATVEVDAARAGYAERRGMAPRSEIVVPDAARAASPVTGRVQKREGPVAAWTAEARPAQATRDTEDPLRAKVRVAQARRDAAENDPAAERPDRRPGLFDGLALGDGQVRQATPQQDAASGVTPLSQERRPADGRVDEPPQIKRSPPARLASGNAMRRISGSGRLKPRVMSRHAIWCINGDS